MSKLISDYMGWNPIFPLDWNMLMEVVDKIENSERAVVMIGNKKCYIVIPTNEEKIVDIIRYGTSTLSATLDCIEEFIKWKNSL